MPEYVNEEYTEEELVKVLNRIAAYGYVVGGAEELVEKGLARHDPDGPHHEYLQLTEAGIEFLRKRKPDAEDTG